MSLSLVLSILIYSIHINAAKDRKIYITASGTKYCLAAGSYSGQSHSLGSGEINLYWRPICEGGGCLEWLWDGDHFTTFYNDADYGLQWDSNKGDGFEISSNERVAKLDPNSADTFYIRSGKYICATASGSECCMEWDGTYYSSGWGDDNSPGRAAKFDCSGGEDTIISDLFSTPTDEAIYTTASGSTYCLSVGSYSGQSHSLGSGEKNLYWAISNDLCTKFQFFDNGQFTTYYNNHEYGMQWDSNLGDGFEISSNERVVKLDPYYNSGDTFYIRSDKYICTTASGSECCIEWDGTYYSSGWQPNNNAGRAAKFDCSGGEDTLSSPLFTRTASTNYVEYRIRKPWHEISSSERNLFINGFKELYNKGYLNDIIREHIVSFTNGQAHFSTAFFPWHRYYLYEFESQIRDLGGAYSSFSLPYWDWTHDSDTNDPVWDILQQGLGGSTGGSCISGSPFDNVLFTQDDDSTECITRNACNQGDSDCTMQSAVELIKDIIADPNLFTFRQQFAYFSPGKHARAHDVIGGGSGTNNQKWSPLDPIFWLLHCYVDFVWDVWQNCHGYDLVDKSCLTGNDDMYKPGGAYDSQGDKGEIDDILDFSALQQSWSHYTKYYSTKTIRDMWSNKDWNVVYDGDSFFQRGLIGNQCNGHDLNTDLFGYSASTLTRRRILENDNNDNNNHLTVFTNWLDENTQLSIKNIAKLVCIYDNMYFNRKPCPRPKYFEDCSDRNKYPINKENGDIDISLNELIKKVENYPCMVKTRKWLYKQAKMDGHLLPLCNGWLDSFSMCDRDWITYYNKDSQNIQQSTIPKIIQPIYNNNNDYQEPIKYNINISYQSMTMILIILLSVLCNIIFIYSFCVNKNKNNNKNAYGAVKYLSDTDVQSV